MQTFVSPNRLQRLRRGLSRAWKSCGILAMLVGLQPTVACSPGDCEVKRCADLAAGALSTNGKSYTKCYLSTAPFETTLEDDQGQEFLDCTDSATQSCLESVVNAEFSYCAAAEPAAGT